MELSLSFHNLVVGANGQRQAMFLENVPGLAARILRNFDITPDDCALVASSSGCNVVPIEMAEEFRRRRVRVVAILSRQHSEKSRSARADGRRLQDFADLVLDTGAPAGDAMVQVPGLATPVAPGSTVGGCLLINAIKAEVADRLTQAGEPPTVLTAAALVGREKATELFEAAYDEHGRRMARLYANAGKPLRPADPGNGAPEPRRSAAQRPEPAAPRPVQRVTNQTSRDLDDASGNASWSPGESRSPEASPRRRTPRAATDSHGRQHESRGRHHGGRSR